MIYAKSPKFGKEAESLEEHTRNVLQAWNRLMQTDYLKTEWINPYRVAVEKMLNYHDKGKANPAFQNIIRRNMKMDALIPNVKTISNIPHGLLSVAFISDEDRDYFDSVSPDDIYISDMIEYAVMFHHDRDDVSREEYVKMLKLMQQYRKELKIDCDFNFDFLPDTHDLRTRLDYNDSNFKKYLPYRVFFKGILHKCDYSASAHIEPEIPYQGDYSTHFTDWLNRQSWRLRPYQQEMKGYSDKSVVLIASTGMGKTECSMNWIDGKKAFYLLGLKTAVNAMYKRFKDIFGDNVSLLHGESQYALLTEMSEDEQDDSDVYIQKLGRARNLSMPITVATADQLVPSVFKHFAFELPYLIASYSHIVVDEIQSFSPESIAAIVTFLKEIHRLGGRFLLMTATLPPFVREEFIPDDEQESDQVIIRDSVLSELKRHCFHFTDTDMSEELERIAGHYQSGKSVLVICNTVKKAQSIYEGLKSFRPALLHSRFTYRDRKNKEADILEKRTPSIWISTQIVEASLDIDFDVLYTESSTVDSLFQRFGRCYRNREYRGSTPNIFITGPGEYYDLIYDEEIHVRTETVLREYQNRLITEQDKQDMIEQVFDTEKIADSTYYTKYKNYRNLLVLGLRADKKSEAQYLFRKIAPQVNIIPLSLYKDNQEKLKSILCRIEDKSLKFTERMCAKKELKDYIIPVQLNTKKQDIMRLPSEFAEDYLRKEAIHILNNCEYDSEKGLSLTERLESANIII